MKRKKEAVDDILAGMVDWLIETNKELITNQTNEKYEKCAEIRDSIENFLIIHAEILFNTGIFIFGVDEATILEKLKLENIYLFEQLTENA